MAFFEQKCCATSVHYVNRSAVLYTLNDPVIYMVVTGIPNIPAMRLEANTWSITPNEGPQRMTNIEAPTGDRFKSFPVDVQIVTSNKYLSRFIAERSDQWMLTIFGKDPDWPLDMPESEKAARRSVIRQAAAATPSGSDFDFNIRRESLKVLYNNGEIDDEDYEARREDLLLREAQRRAEESIRMEIDLLAVQIDILNDEIAELRGE